MGKITSDSTKWPDSEACWFLSQEVFRSLRQISDTVEECIELFPALLLDPHEAQSKQERFVMQQAANQSLNDTAKCVLVLQGNLIVQAELQIKIQKHPNTIHKTSISPEKPWLLTQIQDSGNFLAEARLKVQEASQLKERVDQMKDGVDVVFLQYIAARLGFIIDELMLVLKRGRDCLLSPRKKTIEDHLNSENMKALSPSLPGDTAVSFYVQGHRLMLAVYHLVSQQGNMRFDSFLAECAVSKLNSILVFYTRAFQMCQQIKNKLFWATKCNEPKPVRACSPGQNSM
ncbi:protein rogdi-like [Pollicipes pollicipes]|uniref:protein rogdi-like n=1 Tax=Pollicipes pollicipes TaxID=41117 RepID=UPI001884E80A|nr:protein rogdi-like [Pollicipes pollicipes]XP_037069983.1 protein rogdi-like [Pollicipes pollicipes]XP_037069985.1 protein rogdi-like [Pollicipes pollicipes]